jgi:hypothetical protein
MQANRAAAKICQDFEIYGIDSLNREFESEEKNKRQKRKVKSYKHGARGGDPLSKKQAIGMRVDVDRCNLQIGHV